MPALACVLAISGCLEPIPEDADAGPDVLTLFEVKPGDDLGHADDAADGEPSDVPADALEVEDDAVADAEDVTASDLPDAATEDAGLPEDGTAADAADDATGTVLPDDATSLTCGDGKCLKADKENCKVCPQDCGDCPSICGDGTCQADETCADCPGDCGPCDLACSLFGSAQCLAAEQCYPDGKANFCSASGQKTIGDACLYFNECQKGQLCVGGVCRAICDFSALNTDFLCPPGVSCDKVNVPGKGGVDLGVCGF